MLVNSEERIAALRSRDDEALHFLARSLPCPARFPREACGALHTPAALGAALGDHLPERALRARSLHRDAKSTDHYVRLRPDVEATREVSRRSPKPSPARHWTARKSKRPKSLPRKPSKTAILRSCWRHWPAGRTGLEPEDPNDNPSEWQGSSPPRPCSWRAHGRKTTIVSRYPAPPPATVDLVRRLV